MKENEIGEKREGRKRRKKKKKQEEEKKKGTKKKLMMNYFKIYFIKYVVQPNDSLVQ